MNIYYLQIVFLLFKVNFGMTQALYHLPNKFPLILFIGNWNKLYLNQEIYPLNKLKEVACKESEL